MLQPSYNLVRLLRRILDSGHSTYETASFINETSNDVATDIELDVLYEAMVVH